jgi:hypothetical protein
MRLVDESMKKGVTVRDLHHRLHGACANQTEIYNQIRQTDTAHARETRILGRQKSNAASGTAPLAEIQSFQRCQLPQGQRHSRPAVLLEAAVSTAAGNILKGKE